MENYTQSPMLFHQLYQPLLVVALSSALLSWVLFLIAFIGQSMALAFILIPVSGSSLSRMERN